MNRNRLTFAELEDAALTEQTTRRDLIRRMLALGFSAPAIAGLLAACGGNKGGSATPGATPAAAGTAGVASASGGATTSVASPSNGTKQGGDRLMGKKIDPAASKGGIMIEGRDFDIATLMPILSTDVTTTAVADMIFEKLFEANPDTLEPVGNLADKWSVAGDGVTWTVHLRQGVNWQDGKPFTANDVKLTYDLMMNPKTASPFSSGLISKLESVQVVDDTTVMFKTKGVQADFELDVANNYIIAAHVWKDIAPEQIVKDPGATGKDIARVVGTGPFMFKEWVVGDRVVLVPNKKYWDGTPYLDQFVIKIIQDSAAIIQQLKTGDLDWSGSVSAASVSQLKGTDVDAVAYPTLSAEVYNYNLDTRKTTLFQDAKVRQALYLAIDRNALIKSVYQGYGDVAIGTIPKISWAYNPDGIKPDMHYDYNPVKAKQLLDEAGWTPGQDGVRQKDGKQLAFTMWAISGREVRRNLVIAIQEFWSKIGVKMTPQFEPGAAYVERISKTFDYETCVIGWGGTPTPDQSSRWRCDAYPQGNNGMKYCNPQVDELLDKALHDLDRKKRVELYTEFQNALLPDLPAATIQFQAGLTGVNKRVHNVYPNAVNIRFNAETWWVKS